jgi:hypothetical protein
MKIKFKYQKIFTAFGLVILIGCGKRNFFPDEDDPGLSLLTSRGYNIATMYINNVAYINPARTSFLGGIANALPTVTLRQTSGAFDTLDISWKIEKNVKTPSYNSSYYSVSLLLPVSKTFTARDFSAMSGKSFSSNSDAIAINSDFGYPDGFSGISNIYFVKVNYVDSSATTSRSYAFSGLFNGNIGDSILITKGRFDFTISADAIQF